MDSTSLIARSAGAVERLDTADEEPEVVAGALDDLARINDLLLGTRLTIAAVGDLCRGSSRAAPLSLLDVGCGGGDMAASVVRWSRRCGRDTSAIAIDRSAAIAGHARARCGSLLDVRVGDIRCLELADASVDVAMCSLVLHHLEPSDAVRGLRELARVARLGVVVNDLVRTPIGLAGAHVVVRLVSRNPVTRHDAVLSVKRAYTRDELLELVREARLRPLRTRGALGYRVAIAAAAA